MSKNKNIKKSAALSALMAFAITGSAEAGSYSATELKLLAELLDKGGYQVDVNGDGEVTDADYSVTSGKWYSPTITDTGRMLEQLINAAGGWDELLLFAGAGDQNNDNVIDASDIPLYKTQLANANSYISQNSSKVTYDEAKAQLETYKIGSNVELLLGANASELTNKTDAYLDANSTKITFEEAESYLNTSTEFEGYSEAKKAQILANYNEQLNSVDNAYLNENIGKITTAEAEAELKNVEYGYSDKKIEAILNAYSENLSAYDAKVNAANTYLGNNAATMTTEEAEAYLAGADVDLDTDRQATILSQYRETLAAYDAKVNAANTYLGNNAATMTTEEAEAYLADEKVALDAKHQAIILSQYRETLAAYDAKVDTANTYLKANAATMTTEEAEAYLASAEAGLKADHQATILSQYSATLAKYDEKVSTADTFLTQNSAGLTAAQAKEKLDEYELSDATIDALLSKYVNNFTDYEGKVNVADKHLEQNSTVMTKAEAQEYLKNFNEDTVSELLEKYASNFEAYENKVAEATTYFANNSATMTSAEAEAYFAEGFSEATKEALLNEYGAAIKAYDAKVADAKTYFEQNSATMTSAEAEAYFAEGFSEATKEALLNEYSAVIKAYDAKVADAKTYFEQNSATMTSAEAQAYLAEGYSEATKEALLNEYSAAIKAYDAKVADAKNAIATMSYEDAVEYLSDTNVALKYDDKKALLVEKDAYKVAVDVERYAISGMSYEEAKAHLASEEVVIEDEDKRALLIEKYPVYVAREDISSITSYDEAKAYLKDNTNLTSDQQKALLSERSEDWAYNVKVDDAKVAIKDMGASQANDYLKEQGFTWDQRLVILGTKVAEEAAKEAATKAFEGKSYSEAQEILQDSTYDILDETGKDSVLALAYPDAYAVDKSTTYEGAVDALEKDTNGNLTEAQEQLLQNKYPNEYAVDKATSYDAAVKALTNNVGIGVLTEAQAALLANKYPDEHAVATTTKYEDAVNALKDANGNLSDTDKALLGKYYQDEYNVDNAASYEDAVKALKDVEGNLTDADKALLGKYYQDEYNVDNAASYEDAVKALKDKQGNLTDADKVLLGKYYPNEYKVDTATSYVDAVNALTNNAGVSALSSEQADLLKAKYPNEHTVATSASYDAAVNALKGGNAEAVLNDVQNNLLAAKYPDEHHLATSTLTYDEAIAYLKGTETELSANDAALLAKYYPDNVANDYIEANKETLSYKEAKKHLTDVGGELNALDLAVLAKCYPYQVAEESIAGKNYAEAKEILSKTTLGLATGDREKLLVALDSEAFAADYLASNYKAQTMEDAKAYLAGLQINVDAIENLIKAAYPVQAADKDLDNATSYEAAKKYLKETTLNLDDTQKAKLLAAHYAEAVTNEYLNSTDKAETLAGARVFLSGLGIAVTDAAIDALIEAKYPYAAAQENIADMDYEAAKKYLQETGLVLSFDQKAELLVTKNAKAVTDEYLVHAGKSEDINGAREYLDGIGVNVNDAVIAGLIREAYPVDAAREDISGITGYDEAKLYLATNHGNLTPEQQKALLGEKGWSYNVKLDDAKIAVKDMEYSEARKYLQEQEISFTDQLAILGERLAVDTAKEAATRAFDGKNYAEAKAELAKSNYDVLGDTIKNALLEAAYYDEYTVENAESYDAAVSALKGEGNTLSEKQKQLLSVKYPAEHGVATSEKYEDAVKVLKAQSGELTADDKALLGKYFAKEHSVATSANYQDAMNALAADGVLAADDKALLAKYFANEYTVANSTTYQGAVDALVKGEDGKLTDAQVALLADKYPKEVATEHFATNSANMTKAQAEAYLATLVNLPETDKNAFIVQYYSQDLANDYFAAGNEHTKAEAEAYLNTLNLTAEQKAAYLAAHYPNQVAKEYLEANRGLTKAEAEDKLNEYYLTDVEKAALIATYYPKDVAIDHLENNKGLTMAQAETYLGTLATLPEDVKQELLATYYPSDVAANKIANTTTYEQAIAYLSDNTQVEYAKLTREQKAELLAEKYPVEVAAARIATMTYEEAKAYLANNEDFVENQKLTKEQKIELLGSQERFEGKVYKEIAAAKIATMTYEEAKAYLADKSFVENTKLDGWDKRELIEKQFPKESKLEIAANMMGRMSYQVAKEYAASLVTEDDDTTSENEAVTSKDTQTLLDEQYPYEVAQENIANMDYEQAKEYLTTTNLNLDYEAKKELLVDQWAENVAYDESVTNLKNGFGTIKDLVNSNFNILMSAEQKQEVTSLMDEFVKAAETGDKTKVEAAANALIAKVPDVDLSVLGLGNLKEEVGKLADEVINKIPTPPTVEDGEVSGGDSSDDTNTETPSTPSYDVDDLKNGLKEFLGTIANNSPEAKALLEALESGDKDAIEAATKALTDKIPFEAIKDKVEELVKDIVQNMDPEVDNDKDDSGDNDEQGGTTNNSTSIKDALNNLLAKLEGSDKEAIQNAVKDFLDTIPEDQKQAVQDLLDKVLGSNNDGDGVISEELKGQLDAIKGINDKLGELVEFANKLEAGVDDVIVKAEEFASAVDRNIAAVEDKVNQNLAAVEDKMNNFEAKLEQNLAKVDEKLKENISAVEDKLQEKLDKVDEKIQANVSAVEDKLQAELAEAEDKLQANLAKVEDKVQANLSAVEDKLQDNFAKVEDKLQANLESVDSKFQQNVGAVEDKLQDNINRVEGEVKELVDDVRDHIERNEAEHKELLDKTTDISYDKDSATTKVENNLTVGGSLVVDTGVVGENGISNKVTINENGIKVGENSVYITGNDVTIHDATNGESIKLSTLGNVNDLKGDLAGSETVVDALNNDEATARENADTALQEAIDNEATERENADTALQEAIDNEATARETADIALQEAIDNEATERAKADIALQEAIDKEATERENADTALQEAIDKEATARETADNVLQTNIDKEATARKDADTVLQGNIDAEAKARVEADDAIRKEMASEFERLDNFIGDVNDRAEEVGAMAAAMASLHSMGYDPAAPNEIAIGIGQYRDTTGIAIGAFHYPNRDFMFDFSLSTAGDEVMVNVGANWKIGRKKPQGNSFEEKVAKAEEMKAAARAARAKAK